MKHWSQVRDSIARLGTHLTPQIIDENFRLLAPLHTAAVHGHQQRDVSYGPHERHVLDIYIPAEVSSGPVLVFVHGGGFVSGAKSIAGTPFHDNVGLWAARNGLWAVAVNYRLAPQHPWPAAADDVIAALRWVRKNIASHAGDPGQVVVMGHSAGAAHVGQALAQVGDARRDLGIIGAILVSGIYDTETADKNDLFKAYFGADPNRWAGQSALFRLASVNVPLLAAIAEFDPQDFEQQWVRLLAAISFRGARLPRAIQFEGHGHLSTILTLNAPGNGIETSLLEFIMYCVGSRAKDP